ncbi:MAG: hypothetical protein SOW15_05655 [Ruminococcus callidus]|nr:hypothetical protein [Ruminococcus callidus]
MKATINAPPNRHNNKAPPVSFFAEPESTKKNSATKQSTLDFEEI